MDTKKGENIVRKKNIHKVIAKKNSFDPEVCEQIVAVNQLG